MERHGLILRKGFLFKWFFLYNWYFRPLRLITMWFTWSFRFNGVIGNLRFIAFVGLMRFPWLSSYLRSSTQFIWFFPIEVFQEQISLTLAIYLHFFYLTISLGDTKGKHFLFWKIRNFVRILFLFFFLLIKTFHK